jgi:hypothetical protein
LNFAPLFVLTNNGGAVSSAPTVVERRPTPSLFEGLQMALPKTIRRTVWAGALACWGAVCLSTGLCCLPSNDPPKQSPPQRLTGGGAGGAVAPDAAR